jgi:ABC-type Fe3+ transport system permease subunit
VNRIIAFQFARVVGWLVLAMSVGIVLVATVVEAAPGTLADQSAWPTPRLWGYFRTTIAMASVATLIAFAIAIPFTAVMAGVRHGRQRRVLTALIIMPLVTMPSIHAYAWMLLATRKDGIAAAILSAIGWNTPGAQWVQAAVVLASWLWPIPALILSAAFRHMGRQGYQLARLDAAGLSAFLRGALPLMRAPLIAAVAATFILAATDATIPPLMGATEVWSVEMLAVAATASSHARPIGYLFWQAWPMLALIITFALAAMPGIRRIAAWGDELEGADTGTLTRAPGRTWFFACVLAGAIAFFPLCVFLTEFGSAREGTGRAIMTALTTYRTHGLATLLVAALTGAMAFVASLGVIADPDDHPWAKAFGRLAFTAILIIAILPPEIIGTALAATLTRVCDPRTWNIYDYTPWAWMAALLSRFGVICLVVARLTNRRVPASLLSHAQLEGATGPARIALVRLPFIWRPIAMAALLTACLAMSEIGASVLTQPVRFFGGSLAVQVDMQMHYGRQSETTVLAAIMFSPAVAAALVGAAWPRPWTQA